MKVVHLNTIDQGGSYKAVERINQGMLLNGVDSKILLRTKLNPNNTGTEVISKPLQKLVSKTKNVGNILKSKGDIISDFYGTDMSKHPDVMEADAIFIHWCNSFISYKGFEQLKKLGKPIFIVSHDMWYLTGGCHLDKYCGGYKEECINCPLNKSGLAHKNFELKKKAFNGIDFIGPSKWMADCAENSPIWSDSEISWIHNPIDYDKYKPLPSEEIEVLRKKYKLDSDKKIILYGANRAMSDPNKGGKDLYDVINHLDPEKFQLVIFGNKQKETLSDEENKNHLKVTYLGYVFEESRMIEIYNMADIFLNLSKQESFCYTVGEALACGTPVVAYRVGGIAEQISHKENGYLAELYDYDGLNKGIKFCIDNNIDVFALKKLNNSIKNTGLKYMELLKKIG